MNAQAAGEALDALFTITCGKCGQASPVGACQSTPISGPLPPNQFQCPHCTVAFQRQPVRQWKGYGPMLELVPIAGRL